MDEIIDDITVKNIRKTYSKLSMISAIVALSLFFWIFSLVPTTIKAKDGVPVPPFLLVTCLQGFCFLGMMMTVLSFITKEPNSWYKWMGGITNALIFVLIVGSIIFARVV